MHGAVQVRPQEALVSLLAGGSVAKPISGAAEARSGHQRGRRRGRLVRPQVSVWRRPRVRIATRPRDGGQLGVFKLVMTVVP